jgi:hypothetical protein
MLPAAILAFLIAFLSIQAHADGRVALLMGNGAYGRVPALPNPPRDAAVSGYDRAVLVGIINDA